ncbi:VpaChn25_0724 family phage protein [Algihabitans albus]|uniref:VpaChn25_0724 family phage protein n=1 Tax=Algihabitans albus TaxID=2164067 RepID=UPI000E5DA548|nr:hypothetical protein [Algihabitans albus]
MSWREHLNATRRLSILRCLLEVTNRTLPDAVINRALEDLGHRVERDVVRADLEQLRALDLVTIEELAKGVLEVRVTPQGARVGRGEIQVTGVALPSQA